MFLIVITDTALYKKHILKKFGKYLMKDKVNTDNFKKRKNSAYNATIKRIFMLMAKHRLRFAASICLAVAVVAATLLVPVLTGEAVDSIISE